MDPTIAYLRKRFSQYYQGTELFLPERFGRREWGFMFLGESFMQRHISFGAMSDLQNFLAQKSPAHVYHSAAYYEKPDAPTMEKKKWLGADLIFDLDADHIKGAKNLSYEETLSEVKSEFIRLIDDFLVGDLGFSEKQLTIVFSGGRGYHIHIRDSMVLSLSSHERREIVDYITGRDLDMNWIFPREAFDGTRYGPHVSVKYKVMMPPPESGGWKKKIRYGIKTLTDELDTAGEEKAITMLISFEGVGEKTAMGIYRDLFKGEKGSRGVDRMWNENNLEVFSSDKNLKTFLDIVKGEIGVRIKDTKKEEGNINDILSVKERLEGETDEPVTSDVKRLIRLPSSLHGKTGFMVTPLTRSELDDFNPLSDAIPDIFTQEQLKVQVSQPVNITLKNTSYEFKAGEYEVPEYVAIFLLCRKVATMSQEKTPQDISSFNE